MLRRRRSLVYDQLGTLKGFTKLKHVGLPMTYLDGSIAYGSFRGSKVNIFPPSVESIVVDCNTEMEARFKLWITLFYDIFNQGQLPNLRSFTLKRLMDFRRHGLDKCILEVGSKFREVGVVFIVTDWHIGKVFEDMEKISDGELELDSSASSPADDSNYDSEEDYMSSESDSNSDHFDEDGSSFEDIM
ncbi:hypothetical protein MPH_05647 [Macrophomina phaseolina MS6]|uniref:Uncharacterized protein n=1 Tax=Macrophomina phaseolina (strain MS6) TaxID=1126212 RepID=K2RQY9_MACPH|nr:hypothetical protein MPH_05647 [Macrophomina phaseolina MS6]